MMHFFVVVPFSRPHFAKTVWDNFQRQTHQHKTLVIVENGEAKGKWPYPGCIVLQSGKHQSKAKNRAIEWVREQGGGYIAIFDDDDYYGPKYLEEVVSEGAIENFNIVGKVPHFVWEKRGLFLIQPNLANAQRKWVRGGSTLFHTSKVSFFPIMTTGEDVEFCLQTLRNGGHVYSSSPYHCCYMRNNEDHTYKENVVETFRYHQHLILHVSKTLDLNLINGDVPWQAIRPL
jgi:glycosyltransferase involved in cell wall biosynthesis